jgi:hypothetical protein
MYTILRAFNPWIKETFMENYYYWMVSHTVIFWTEIFSQSATENNLILKLINILKIPKILFLLNINNNKNNNNQHVQYINNCIISYIKKNKKIKNIYL